ncbi:hypothetical protein SBOR_0756 [Sclerotinia borealis F-4128]|uniref:Uncharacterized protein n=1 Tax=Sclerotinia borealis (strain F-4128) TaxID=1432307 RepID=W9CS25_SCLBF|nr:hypothetical protein SBOR_0756 [Sclerotinia borealis F-4128]
MSSSDTNNETKTTSVLSNLLPSSFKTPGVQNIEKAYSRAGATNNHTPGYASALGSQDQKGGSENQGVGSAKFAEGISDQRGEPSVVGKMFNNLINARQDENQLALLSFLELDSRGVVWKRNGILLSGSV